MVVWWYGINLELYIILPRETDNKIRIVFCTKYFHVMSLSLRQIGWISLKSLKNWDSEQCQLIEKTGNKRPNFAIH